MQMQDLFDGENVAVRSGAVLLRGRALPFEAPLLAALDRITAEAPFRHMVTPGGFEMSVAMTNCGSVGWVTDRTGYRYDPRDPSSGRPWPELPEAFRQLAYGAAEEAGYPGFSPRLAALRLRLPTTTTS